MKKYLLLIVAAITFNFSFAQEINLDAATDGNTYMSCTGRILWSGNPGFDYSNNEDYEVTFCNPGGGPIRANIVFINTEGGFDGLSFYDGPSSASPLLGTMSGFGFGGSGVFTAAGPCITVRFTSDGTITWDNIGFVGGYDVLIGCLPTNCANGSPAADDDCGTAPQICSLDNYCGNTGGWYTPGLEAPTLQNPGPFCGSIENNSWISFTAENTSATFDITSSNCLTAGSGVQAQIFDTDCSVFTSVSNCVNQSTGPGTNTLTATGLTPGNTYYIMVDGFGGNICDYNIIATSGVAVVSINSSGGTDLCPTECTTLELNTVTPATTYSWSASPAGTAGLSTTGGGAGDSIVTLCPTANGTYTIIGTASGICGGSVNDTIVITVGTPNVDFHAEQPFGTDLGVPADMLCTDPIMYYVANDSAVSGGYITPSMYFEFTSDNNAIADGSYIEIWDGVPGGGGTMIFTNGLNDNTVYTVYGEYFSPSSAYYIVLCESPAGDGGVSWQVYDGVTNAVYGTGTMVDGFPCETYGPFSPAGVASWSTTAPLASVGAWDWGGMFFDPCIAGPGTYDFWYHWDSSTGCLDSALHTINVTSPFDASWTSPGNQCETAGAISLNPLVTGTAGGTWSGPGVSGSTFNPAGLGGTSVSILYTVGTAPCCVDTMSHTIVISTQESAGLDDLVNAMCNSGGTLDLNTLLNGNTTVGTWAETSGSGQFNVGTGVFDANGLAAATYTFTYTVSSTAPCIADVADFSVQVNNQENAGLDDLVNAICNSGATLDLNTLLNGNTTVGTWAETSGSGQFNVGTGVFDANGLAAATYTFTYTVTGTAPCIASVADFSVQVSAQESAGLDDLVNAMCNSGGTLDLNTLLNGNTTVGTWAETSGSGQFNAGTGVFDANGLAAATYTFTYTVTNTAPCIADESNFSVQVNNQENAGLDDLVNAMCNSGATLDLNTLLNGNTTVGTWAETSGSGQFNVGTGVFDANGLAGATYTFTYTVAGTSPCIPDVADFSVQVSAQENAGLDDLVNAICNSGATLDLNTLLSGNTTVGTWAETSGSGQFNAGTGVFDANGLAAATYTFTYTVTSSAPCIPDVAAFSVQVSNQSNAGTDNAVGICATAGPMDLFLLLGVADLGGTWVPAMMSGTGVFDPASDPAATYQYIVTGTAPCPDDTADVVVTITALDDPTFVYPDFCVGSGGTPGVINTPGGTFSFNPDPGDGATIVPGSGVIANEVGGGVYNIQYLTPAGPCQDSVTMVVNVGTPVNAGTNTTLTTCSTSGTTDLFPLLGGADLGGAWLPVMTSGTGVFDPAVDAAVTYTYTVTGANGCPNATGDVAVTVNTAPNAGTDNTLTACSTDGTTDLFTLLGVADLGGTWLPAMTSGTGVFDPAVDAATTYQYIVTGLASCTDDTADVVVTINTAPNAGTDNTLGICATGSPMDLFTLLGVADLGGTWLPAMASGTGVFDPAVDPAATYQYIVAGLVPCADDTADVVVTITANDDPTFTYPDFCAGSGGVVGIINTPGGTFSFNPDPADGATIVPGTGVIANEVAGGVYNIQYLTPAGPCQDSLTIAVNIGTPANAGTDNTLATCGTAATTDLFTLLGVADAGGTWVPAMASGTGVFNPAVDPSNTYQYVVTGTAPCADDTSDVIVTVTATDDPTFTYADFCADLGGVAGVINTPGGTFSFNPDPADGSTINATTGAITNGVGGSIYNIQYLTPTGPCQSSLTIAVNANGVVANISATPLSGSIPLNVTLDGTGSTGAITSYQWNFGDGNTGTGSTNSNIYTGTGSYNVVLTVTDAIGCNNTTSITIDAFGESTILIPNVFTPNGDGSNDIFTVEGVNLETVEGEIFNRWGQKMFSWSNVKGHWDGRTLSGTEAPDGTYFYMITAKGFDGEEYSKKGGFSLIR